MTEVSHWWDSKGENEIDLIAIEKLDKHAVVAEVKRNARRYSAETLNEKYQNIKLHLRGYQVELQGCAMGE